jgi:transposase
MGVDQIHVLADRGYFSGKEIVACEAVGAIPYVPKPYTSEAKAAGRFAKDDFTFNAADNTYRCPAGEALTYRFTSVEHDLKLDVYWTTKCSACPIRSRCTTDEIRRIKRWEHEGVVDAMLQRLEAAPDSMIVRRRTVEHPFGTLKSWMGATHFLTKGLDNVATEMSLNVLAYNLKRMMAIIGVKPLIERLAA